MQEVAQVGTAAMAEAQGLGPAVQEGPAVTAGVDEAAVLDAGVVDLELDDPEEGDPPVGLGPAEHGVVG
jgi:hypothetical protein